MGVDGEKQLPKPEVVADRNSNQEPDATIEDELKKKLPENPEKQQFFLNIFNQQDIQKSFSQKDIAKYIKENLNINFFRILKLEPIEEQTKSILEDMDDFFKQNGGMEKILVSKDILSDEITKTHNKVEKTDKKNEKNEKQIDIGESFLKTKEAYDKLDKSKYPEPTDKEINEQKKNIAPKIKEQLESKGKTIEEYTKFLIIEKNYEKELRKNGNTEFLDNLKELKQGLGDETTLAKTMDSDHTDLIVENNKSLKDFTENSERFDKISKPILPELKDFDKEFDSYVKFIPDKNIRENIIKLKKIIKEYNKNYAGNEDDYKQETSLYHEYENQIDMVKKNLSEKTQLITKQRVMGTCITGLARYFDTTTVNKDNFADDFDIQTQKGFTIQKGEKIDEKGDDILYIKGNIKGNTVGFYYNLTNPDAQLQSDDFLHFDEITKNFSIGPNNGGKNNLGVKLPTLGMLSEQAQGISKRDFDTLLEKSENWEDFQSSFKQDISNKLLKNYGQEALVKVRVEKDIEKNMTTQTAYETFIPNVVATEMSKKPIDKTMNKKARMLMEMRDKNTENMKSDELRRLRSLIGRLDRCIGQKNPHLEKKRQSYLDAIDKEKGTVEYPQDRGKSTLKFFQKFSKNGQINLEDLNTFINILEKKEDVEGNISKFSSDFVTTEEHEDADRLVENI